MFSIKLIDFSNKSFENIAQTTVDIRYLNKETKAPLKRTFLFE